MVAVVEVAFESEEVTLKEVVGEVGGGEAEAEDHHAGDDDVRALVRGEVRTEVAAKGLVEIGEEDEVKDVDAVAVFTEPAHRPKSADAGDERRVE